MGLFRAYSVQKEPPKLENIMFNLSIFVFFFSFSLLKSSISRLKLFNLAFINRSLIYKYLTLR